MLLALLSGMSRISLALLLSLATVGCGPSPALDRQPANAQGYAPAGGTYAQAPQQEYTGGEQGYGAQDQQNQLYETDGTGQSELFGPRDENAIPTDPTPPPGEMNSSQAQGAAPAPGQIVTRGPHQGNANIFGPQTPSPSPAPGQMEPGQMQGQQQAQQQAPTPSQQAPAQQAPAQQAPAQAPTISQRGLGTVVPSGGRVAFANGNAYADKLNEMTRILRRCGGRQRNGALYRLQVHVTPAGTVDEVGTDSAFPARVNRCVSRRVRRVSFPPSEGPLLLDYPLSTRR